MGERPRWSETVRDAGSGLLDRPHLSATVVATVRAHLMRRFWLVTLRALAQEHRFDLLMRAALRRA